MIRHTGTICGLSRPERAIEELLKALDFAPGNGLALLYLGYPYVEIGRHGDAIESFTKAREATGGMPWVAESIGFGHGLRGDRSRAELILREAEARMASGYVPSSGIALIHLGLGDDDAVLHWLNPQPVEFRFV